MDEKHAASRAKSPPQDAPEGQAWVPAYMQGQPRGFFQCHMALTHKFVHIREGNAIRGLMGRPGR
jgi:hypothetical protein